MDIGYHIRGMQNCINCSNNTPTLNGGENDLFSYKLDFETGTPAAAGFYDGNIGKQSWLNRKDNQNRSFTYNYDAASRFKSATYAGLGSENFSLPNMSYDKNGNITNLQRFGRIGTGYGLMDNLIYNYNGNQLTQVTDAINGNNEVDFVSRGAGNYNYYPNGALKSDENEQISNIIYNTFLKLPTEIYLTDGRWIKYYYDGFGTHLKTVYSNNETWINNDEVIYKNNNIYQIASPEGRMTPKTGGSYQYEFFYKDHLGNTRLTFRDSLAAPVAGVYFPPLVLSQTAFDPWGVVLRGAGQVNAYQNRFEFQNKEKESTFGLNRINLGARTLNPTNGRFDRVDIMTDKLPFSSTYVYNMNNPLRYIDPDGAFPYPVTVRSFAPIGSFKGTGFHDDGRSYSTRSDVTSRISQTYTIDPSARAISGGTPVSSPTIFETPIGTFSKSATDEGSVNAVFSKNKSGNIANVNSEFEGSNPFFFGVAPNIEVASKIQLTENLDKGTLGVSINLSSKQFPATEATIQDSKKQSIFLGGAAAFGNAGDLVKADKKPISSLNLTIKIDKKGVFQSISYGNKTYSIEEFNKTFTPKSAGPNPR
jgi:RHS repeat-associated protein